jgi:hypothetical protein
VSGVWVGNDPGVAGHEQVLSATSGDAKVEVARLPEWEEGKQSPQDDEVRYRTLLGVLIFVISDNPRNLSRSLLPTLSLPHVDAHVASLAIFHTQFYAWHAGLRTQTLSHPGRGVHG